LYSSDAARSRRLGVSHHYIVPRSELDVERANWAGLGSTLHPNRAIPWGHVSPDTKTPGRASRENTGRGRL
jgi:hypothetical protein